MSSPEPNTIEEVQEFVRTRTRVLPHGNLTKPNLARADGFDPLPLTGLAGITAYEPSEFVFTALAGTPLGDVEKALAEHGQCMPFDPLYATSGSTIGGAIAASAGGPGQVRYGGVRDFVVGIRYVDSYGRIIQGGGKVVKNAAGFDLPKLFTGSLGRLGVIVEASFKVFPKPTASFTGRIEAESLENGVSRMTAMTRLPAEFEAMEMDANGVVTFRIGGDRSALHSRLDAISTALEHPVAEMAARDAAVFWNQRREPGKDAHSLIKVPIHIGQLTKLNTVVPEGCGRWFSVAGNAAWITAPSDQHLDGFPKALVELGLTGIVYRGSASYPPRIGALPSAAMEKHTRSALDPLEKFPPYQL